MSGYILTHIHPDWDAIGSVWLLKRFTSLSRCRVVFVSASEKNRKYFEEAQAVVDIGGVHDAETLRFDHHQLSENITCATEQVYEFLLTEQPELLYLQPLINLIRNGDTGQLTPEVRHSKQLGIHALLAGKKVANVGDRALMTYGFEILDLLNGFLEQEAKAASELCDKLVWKSPDDVVWAIRYGSVSTTYAAYAAGAKLIVFEGEPMVAGDGMTYPVGVARAEGLSSPHVGELVSKIMSSGRTDPKIKEELSRWFLHPSGFFAGRGTFKSPCPHQFTIDLQKLAQLIYATLRNEHGFQKKGNS